MSTTTTETRVENGSFHSAVLRDYELHHSQSREETPESRPVSVDHPEFDMPHRRVPSYRPLNRDPEHINGGAAQTWRASVGKFTDKVWKYPIGGEF
ncbi:hypothetical protein FCULG_00000289 [Fusarium culmorum]|uniref:Uncharacterized protein n=1 Tax=Fusarium culmorum TaxID=5516 RepID=A0A2T4GK32_FUSCU|nr:hypothetical protein FCULG_00000289 [Fusarium culmorum]